MGQAERVQISPRYDGAPLIRLDGDPAAVGEPLVRQRRRLAKVLASLSPEQWAIPSRCEGWRVQDVVAHLVGTDQFWNLAITSGLAGKPTRFLATFDPKATPAAMVDAVRDATPVETLASFRDASEALCATVESLDGVGWTALAESPVGHVTVSAAAHHALWDAWVHERDILEPLGLAADEEPDEIAAALRYVAGLAPALALQSSAAGQYSRGRSGVLAVAADGPPVRAVVRVGEDVSITEGDPPEGALVLMGGAVDVLEALSVRAPLRQEVPDDDAWLVAGLTDVFETTSAA